MAMRASKRSRAVRDGSEAREARFQRSEPRGAVVRGRVCVTNVIRSGD